MFTPIITGLLETIRFSITRLKLDFHVYPHNNRFAWNNKILDYEIETDVVGFHNLLIELKDLKQ